MIKLNLEMMGSKSKSSINMINKYESRVAKAVKHLEKMTKSSKYMTGWLEYPNEIDPKMVDKIITTAESIKDLEIKNILLIGIGGSYAGVRALIDACLPQFNRQVNFYYASNMSPRYVASLMKQMANLDDFAIVVISKSGTTIEPSVCLRNFYSVLVEKVGSEAANERVIAITDAKKGTLKELVDQYNWKSFPIPNSIGGRFSAITPVGLLPMALAGINIREFIKGCQKALLDSSNSSLIQNNCYQYAAVRHFLYKKGKCQVEVFNVYDEELYYLTEHLKQLFGESEGKKKTGLLPINCLMTTELHSMGQFLQDGSKIFFETTIIVNKQMLDSPIHDPFNKLDKMEFLDGLKISDLSRVAREATLEAHTVEGKIPNIIIEVEEMNAKTIGYLYSWFSKAVAISGLLNGINPFDQPGVESYKKIMFKKLHELTETPYEATPKKTSLTSKLGLKKYKINLENKIASIDHKLKTDENKEEVKDPLKTV